MRYLIYFIYNGEGRIDGYIPPLLAQLRARYDVIHVVFNGTLAQGESEKLRTIADKVQERDNIEFDVGAYKAALFSNPDDFYAGLRELTLANFTFFAPVGGFSDYFAWSDTEPQDFWGISAHKGMTPNPFTGEGELPYHIQSHWISIGPKILKSKDFMAYWRNLPVIDSYMGSVLHHESQFTRHFSDLGYSYGVFLDDSTYSSDYPAFNEVERAVKEGFPLLKRRLFYHIPAYLDCYEVNLRGAMEHIERNALYNTDLVWNSVIGSVDPGVLYQNADLLYIVPDKTALPDRAEGPVKFFLLASGEFTAENVEAIVRAIEFDCVVTILAPSERFSELFEAATRDNGHIVEIHSHLYGSLPECFQLLVKLLEPEDKAQALLFAPVSARDLDQFQYGLDHLARDSLVTNLARARLQNASGFGLVLPPARTYGKSPDTSILTEENRFELQTDLNTFGMDVSLEDYVLYSTAGVMWVRAGLLDKVARHLAQFVQSPIVFEEFGHSEDESKALFHATDEKEFDSFFAAGLPYFASENGYGTFVLSNTAALPRNFVKLEARYRRFAERLGTGDPFELASHSDYLMRFSSQEDREAIFSEVHRQAYEKGWQNAVDLVWKKAITKGHGDFVRELSAQVAEDPTVKNAVAQEDLAMAGDRIREKITKEGFDKGFDEGWRQGAEKAFEEGWTQALAANSLNRRRPFLHRIFRRQHSKK